MNADTANSSCPARVGRADTRSQLLQVGAELISTQGYNNTGIKAILDAAGVPKGSFYYYFASKEELFRELVQEMGHATRAQVAGAIAKAPDRLSAERAGLEAFLRFVAARPALHRIVEEARFADPEAYQDYFSGFAEGYATGLREAEARGEVSPGDAEVRAWALMGMAKALGDRFVLWDDAPDIEHVVEEAHRMICRGLAP